jgi:hypothetical protein
LCDLVRKADHVARDADERGSAIGEPDRLDLDHAAAAAEETSHRRSI